MKKLTTGTVALLVAGLIGVYSCGGPNDDSGSQDSNFSGGEGEIDSSRLVQSDTSSAYIANPDLIKGATKVNNKHGG